MIMVFIIKVEAQISFLYTSSLTCSKKYLKNVLYISMDNHSQALQDIQQHFF